MHPQRPARRRLSRFTAAGALAAALVTTAGAEVTTTFAGAPPSGRYEFPSWTPKTLAELMKGNAAAEKVDITGHLFLPAGGERVPAVVLAHGSGGIYNAMVDYWPKQFNAAGMAVFALNMFEPRGVRSTADDQALVPFTADVADVFAALKLIASHPRIDPQRIALMGFSRGGTATLRAAVERIIASQKLPDGLRYAAFIPTYAGGCAGVFRLVVRPGVFSTAPMLFLHGDRDDYTPIAPCQDYAAAIAKAGTPVEFVVLPGAQHKFDSDDTRRFYLGSARRTKAECPLAIDIDTFYAYDRNTGARIQGPAYGQVLKDCGAAGATVEGNRAARDKAAEVAVAFLRKTFAR